MKNNYYLCQVKLILCRCKTIKKLKGLLTVENSPLAPTLSLKRGKFPFLFPQYIGFCTVCLAIIKQCIEHRHNTIEVKTCSVWNLTTGQPIMKMTSMVGQYRGVQMFIDSCGLIKAAIPYKEILWGIKVLCN